MPSFYAIIPANVRYDKSLPANAKLLYGEITALCNEKGYCWATNNYFAELYEVAPETVSRWVSKLEKYGYLEVDHSEIQGNNRKIRISTPIDEKIKTPPQKDQDPLDEKIKQNTTVNTTVNINTEGRLGEKESVIELPFKSEEFKTIWQEWLKYRKEKKVSKYTERGLGHTFKHLVNISQGDEKVSILILEQSMANGWQGIFALKNKPVAKQVPKTMYQQSLENARASFVPTPE